MISVGVIALGKKPGRGLNPAAGLTGWLF